MCVCVYATIRDDRLPPRYQGYHNTACSQARLNVTTTNFGAKQTGNANACIGQTQGCSLALLPTPAWELRAIAAAAATKVCPQQHDIHREQVEQAVLTAKHVADVTRQASHEPNFQVSKRPSDLLHYGLSCLLCIPAATTTSFLLVACMEFSLLLPLTSGGCAFDCTRMPRLAQRQLCAMGHARLACSHTPCSPH